MSCSCVPLSATIPSFMHLKINKKKKIRSHQNAKQKNIADKKKEKRTHIIWSACLVRCPNRWVTKTIVFPSLAAISRSNNFNSPSASSAELGSSTATNLTFPDLKRMNERALRVKLSSVIIRRQSKHEIKHSRSNSLAFSSRHVDHLSNLLQLIIERMSLILIQVQVEKLYEGVQYRV